MQSSNLAQAKKQKVTSASSQPGVVPQSQHLVKNNPHSQVMSEGHSTNPYQEYLQLMYPIGQDY